MIHASTTDSPPPRSETRVEIPVERPSIPLVFYPAMAVVICAFLFFLMVKSRKASRSEEEPEEPVDDEDFPWEQLFEIANRTIAAEIAALPAAIKSEVSRVPYLLEKWCPDGQNLGLYLEFEPGQVSEADGPIFIYIGDHYLYADEDLKVFEKEVRRTYLHELCHHFGLDEHHIEERGLE